MEEEWRLIDGYFGFMVSNLGNVKSLDRIQLMSDGKAYSFKGHILRKSNNGYGYYVVNLRQFGQANVCPIHRLVATAFLPNPDNLPCINHKDGIKTNNHVDNLEWCTYGYNLVHALEHHLRHPRGNPIKQVDLQSGEIINIFKSSYEAERQTGITANAISHVLNGRGHSAGGYYWERVEGQSTIENISTKKDCGEEVSRVHAV